MTVTYDDVIDVVHNGVRADGRRLDAVVLKDDVVDSWKENMVKAELGQEREDSPLHRDDFSGVLNGFDVRVGDENKVVCQDGTEYEL